MSKLQKAYDKIYDLVGLYNDEPLEILDKVIDKFNMQSVLEKWLEEIPLTVEEERNLLACFKVAFENCEWELQ